MARRGGHGGDGGQGLVHAGHGLFVLGLPLLHLLQLVATDLKCRSRPCYHLFRYVFQVKPPAELELGN